MRKLLANIVALTFVFASLSCHSIIQVGDTQVVTTSSKSITKLHFPQPWLDPMEGSYVQQLEVRKVPNAPDDEFFFGALPYGDNNYAHEVDKKMPEVTYGKNVFAVNFSNGPRARTATQQEWESALRIPAKPRRVFPKGPDYSSGAIEYRQKRYAKPGKYWGESVVSPTGKWLATFSYSGEKRPPDLFFGGGEPLVGDVFCEIYDVLTGKKVFEWQVKNAKNPSGFDDPVVWLEDRYFLFPEDEEAQNFIVVTLPPVTSEENPVTIQLPSRKDANGKSLPPGASDEVWIPLSPLTKEQAAKLTARSDTEIKEVRLSRALPQELLLAIDEETENRPAHRDERDGARDYHFRLISTYYFAIALDHPTQTRMATKEDWDRAQTVTTRRSEALSEAPAETVTGTIPPYRQFAKTGRSWGSSPRLSAGEWIAVFSYNGNVQDGKMFVDVYDQRLGDKFLSTTLTAPVSPNELFKGALWIDGGYVLLPLNTSVDSFAFWQLP